MDIANLYEGTQKTLQQIADELGLGYKAVWGYVNRNYPKEYRDTRKRLNYSRSKMGDKNPMYGIDPKEHPRYIGDVSDSKGYLMRLKPGWYTGRRNSRHVFSHHIVYCENTGLTEIPRGYVIHHCNQVKTDNDFDNLLMMTQSEHTRLHLQLGSVTTISKESTAKWLEALRRGDPYDIV